MQISGRNMSMTRGDSETLTVLCRNSDGSPHPFEVGDTVYFTVKWSPNADEKLMQKVVTDFGEKGEAVIEIAPEDTKALNFGTYKYDVQLTFASGRVTTIIPPSSFRVMEEITDD